MDIDKFQNNLHHTLKILHQLPEINDTNGDLENGHIKLTFVWIVQRDQIVGTCYESGREPLMPFLWQDRCRRILELNARSSILVLWIWRKLLIGCQEK